MVCKFCNAPNTTARTCPLNEKAKNPDYKKHPNIPRLFSISLQLPDEYDIATLNPRIIKKLKFQGIKDYDIVKDTDTDDYRNNGRYMFYNNHLYNLDDTVDEYGSLPCWVKLADYDLGWSYFKRDLIRHNTLIPIKFSEWDIVSIYDSYLILERKSDYVQLEIVNEYGNSDTIIDYLKSDITVHFDLERPLYAVLPEYVDDIP
jgi:hypothetical protein